MTKNSLPEALFSKVKTFLANENNKIIFAMFFPILFEQFIITCMGTVHSIMLANVGKQAISAVSLIDQLNQFAYAILGSVSLGATIVVSQYMGNGKTLSAKATSEQAISLGFIISIITAAGFIIFSDQIFVLFFSKKDIEPAVFDYSMTYMFTTALSFPMLSVSTTAAGIIRGTGDAKTPMLISFITGFINVILAWLFIIVFGLAVYGAGIAIIISRLAGGIIGIILLVYKGFLRNIKFLFKIRFKFIYRIFRIGMYSGAENMIFQLGRTLTQSFYITSGTDHITANGIAGNIFNIIAVPGNSMSIVATTVIGRLTGAGEKKRSYEVLKNIVIISSVTLFIIHLIFFPLAPALTGLYTNELIITGLVKKLFYLNFLFVPTFWSVAFVLFSGMKGAGDARNTTIVSITSMWLVRVLFSFLLGKLIGMGVIGVWLGMFFDWVARGTVAVIRFRSRKWQNYSAIN